jgi:hypothetical protein
MLCCAMPYYAVLHAHIHTHTLMTLLACCRCLQVYTYIRVLLYSSVGASLINTCYHPLNTATATATATASASASASVEYIRPKYCVSDMVFWEDGETGHTYMHMDTYMHVDIILYACMDVWMYNKLTVSVLLLLPSHARTRTHTRRPGVGRGGRPRALPHARAIGGGVRRPGHGGQLQVTSLASPSLA